MVVGGGMWANTETSRSSARAGAATTMSILHHKYYVEFHCPYIQKAISAYRLFQVRTISNFKDLPNHFDFPFTYHDKIN